MTWADTFGMVIALAAVMITILAVWLAYMLSRTYVSHVQEIQAVRTEYQSVLDRLEQATRVNTCSLRESMLAVRSIFDLVMLATRRRDFDRRLNDLRTQKVWREEPVSEDQMQIYATRIEEEIKLVESTIMARETEMYWLVGGKNEQGAHLHALAETRGDAKSIDLLEELKTIEATGRDREELIEALSRLRHRLGRTRFTRARAVSSTRWTGR